MTEAMDILGQLDILLDESTVTLKLKTGTYKVRKMTVGDVAALQNHMKQEFNRPVSTEEIFSELLTPEGATFILWRRLKESDPSLTLEKVRDVIPASADAVMKLLKTLGLEAAEGKENPPNQPGASG